MKGKILRAVDDVALLSSSKPSTGAGNRGGNWTPGYRPAGHKEELVTQKGTQTCA